MTMHRTFRFTFTLWLLWTGSLLPASADKGDEELDGLLENEPTVYPDAVPDREYDLPFPVGETLEYRIKWGWLSVAKSKATTRWVDVDGRVLLQILFRTKSNSYLQHLYPVDDTIESLVDPETLLPVQFTKRLSEGSYRAHEVTVFDHAAGTATWTSMLSEKTKTYEIEPDTRDLVSFMYAMRRHDLAQEQEVTEQVMADEKVYDLLIRTGEEKKVKLKKYGKVKSLRVEPKATFQGIFVRKGEMVMWVSRDDRRIFTKLMIDTPFANVRLFLRKVTGGPDDDWWDPPPEQEEQQDEEAPAAPPPVIVALPTTPSLFYAAAKGDAADVQAHLAAGADVHASKGGAGTALHLAATADVATALLEAGAKVDARSPIDWTPLHAAAVRGRAPVVATLLAAGADVNAAASDQRTPMHLAAERGHVEAVKHLLGAKASLTAVSNTGWTPLHFAAAKGRLEVIELLLRAGAPVNAQSKGGGTPLIEAAVGQPAAIVQALLAAGADPTLQENQGKTALDFAREFGNADAVKLLAP